MSYRIIVTNANGNGAPTEKEAFIGLDIPAAPNNLQAKKESFDKVVLSWSAPTASVNGGWFNPQDVVYKVVRNNGTEIVANTNELTVSDQVTDYPQTCTYTVTAFNKAGEGGSAIIGNMVLGPKNTLPFTCDFNDNQAASQWTPIDADGDGNNHSEEDAGTDGVTAGRPGTRGEYQGQHAENEGQGGHQDRAEAGSRGG